MERERFLQRPVPPSLSSRWKISRADGPLPAPAFLHCLCRTPKSQTVHLIFRQSSWERRMWLSRNSSLAAYNGAGGLRQPLLVPGLPPPTSTGRNCLSQGARVSCAVLSLFLLIQRCEALKNPSINSRGKKKFLTRDL